MNRAIRGRGQAGLSLIELMVAMAAGMLLIAGVAQMFIASRQANRLQDGFGALQENGRLALYLLRRDIRMAGFPREQDIDAFLVGPTQTVDGGGPNESDAITVQYVSGQDCLGQATPAGLAVNRYYVATADGVNRLMCLGNGNAVPQPLVDGVESLQLLYGEDRDGDEVPDVYVSAGSVLDWGDVVAVRVSVLVASLTAVLDEDISRSFTMLDEPAIGPFDDRQQRQVFTTTVEVRNRTP